MTMPSFFAFRARRSTAASPVARLHAIAGRERPAPSCHTLCAARRLTIADARAAWLRGDADGAAVFRTVADALRRSMREQGCRPYSASAGAGPCPCGPPKRPPRGQ